MSKPLIVLLPGTDGTGMFFGPLRIVLEPDAEVRIVAYPQTGDQSYESLGRLLLETLPADRDYVLLGESFGGPLAVWLAAHAARKPTGLILGASFAASPFGALGRLVRPLIPVAQWLPLWTWQIDMILFNGRNRKVAEWVHNSVRQIDKVTLLARVQSVLGCDMWADLAGLDMPILCLDAARDRLVWPWLPRHVPKMPNVRVVSLDLPHMIFQSAPETIARDLLLPFLRESGHD